MHASAETDPPLMVPLELSDDGLSQQHYVVQCTVDSAPEIIKDEQVALYIGELQFYVCESRNGIDRYSKERLDLMSKVRELDAVLDGKVNFNDWRPFSTADFQSILSSPPPIPRGRPNVPVLAAESYAIRQYVATLEEQAAVYGEQISALLQDTHLFADLVERLNLEVIETHEKQERDSTGTRSPTPTKQKRLSFIKRRRQSISKVVRFFKGGLVHT